MGSTSTFGASANNAPAAAAIPDENAIARPPSRRADRFFQSQPRGGAMCPGVLTGFAANVACKHDWIIQRFA